MSDFLLTFDPSDGVELGFDTTRDMQLDLGATAADLTGDYNKLANKPSIETVELIGNKTFKQLGLEAMTPQDVDKIIYG